MAGAIVVRGEATFQLAAEPDAWMEAMRRGALEEAWALSDAVLKSRAGVPCWHWPRHLQYVWNGEPLEGKRVLVRCYHGLGDTVQFVRFLPQLKAIAAEVTVWAQPELIPLLRSAEGIDWLLPLHDGVPEGEYDAEVEVMELAHVFRITLETLPARVPYLHGPIARGASWRDDRRNVGIVWRAGEWDDRRSVPIRMLEPLTRVAGVTFQVLQQGPARREWPAEVGLFSGAKSLEGLASVMCALDLVITIDSLPAHLAGALGVRTWTLLQADPDWRWMLRRSDSPWYPTMRLFRQKRAGEWGPVIERLAAELSDFVRRS